MFLFTSTFGSGNLGSPPPSGDDDFPVIGHMPAPVDGVFDLIDFDLTEYQCIVAMADGLTVEDDGSFVFAHLYIDGVLGIDGARWVDRGYSTGGSTEPTNSVADSGFQIVGGDTSNWGVGNGAGKCYSGRIEISNADTALYKTVRFDGQAIGPTGESVRHVGGGHLGKTANITGILINAQSAIQSGILTIYGQKYGARTGAAVAPALKSMWVGALT